jgi:8-amino-7-oxononanoate synthase
LIQQARTYIYTTALPPALAEALVESLQVMHEESWRRQHLVELVSYFRTQAEALNLPLLPSALTPIQPIILGTATAVMAAAARLRERGYFVVPIRPPTVPEGTARLRITLSAQHTERQVDEFVIALSEAL